MDNHTRGRGRPKKVSKSNIVFKNDVVLKRIVSLKLVNGKYQDIRGRVYSNDDVH